MTAFPSYSTGTVSVGAGATTIVGVSTIWSGVNARPGDDFVCAGHTVVITDVTDTTHLVIDAWPYTAVTAGTTYKIVQRSPLRFAGGQAMADVSALVAAMNTDGFYVFVASALTVPDPSLGNDNQFAFQPTTGKLWLKTAGVWVFQGIFKAFNPRGAWSSVTAYIAFDVVTIAGSSYICILANTNQTPPNATYWQLLASIGATGSTGPAPWTVPAAWVTATAYVTGPPASLVVQAGESYVCLVAHTSGTFATDLAASKWLKVSQKGSGDLLSTNNLSDVTDRSAAAVNLGVPSGYRNLIGRNGGLEIWQRGVSLAVPASTTAYTADGWYIKTGATQAHTVARAAPITSQSTLSGQVQRNSGQTGTGIVYFAFPLSLDELIRAAGKSIMLSAKISTGANWSPASGTITYSVLFGTGPVGKRNASPYTGETSPINGTINVAAGTTAASLASVISAAVATNVAQCEVLFSWTPVGTAGANDWIRFDDVQLEIVTGTIGAAGPTPVFERTLLVQDLERCLPYYEKSYGLDVTPGTATDRNGARWTLAFGTGQIQGSSFQFPKAGIPTVDLYSYNGTINTWSVGTTDADTAAATPVEIGTNGWFRSGCSGLTVGAQYYGHFVAKFEI